MELIETSYSSFNSDQHTPIFTTAHKLHEALNRQQELESQLHAANLTIAQLEQRRKDLVQVIRTLAAMVGE